MLEKYEKLIYKNENEKAELKKQIIADMRQDYPKLTDEKFYTVLNREDSDEYNNVKATYNLCISIEEHQRLFDKAAEILGNKLWSGKAWHNKTCTRLCPFGALCRQNKDFYMFIAIDEVKYCRGQVYYFKLYEQDSAKLLQEHEVSFVKDNGKTRKVRNEEDLDSHLVDIDSFIAMSFGTQYIGRNGVVKEPIGKRCLNAMLKKQSKM